MNRTKEGAGTRLFEPKTTLKNYPIFLIGILSSLSYHDTTGESLADSRVIPTHFEGFRQGDSFHDLDETFFDFGPIGSIGDLRRSHGCGCLGNGGLRFLRRLRIYGW